MDMKRKWISAALSLSVLISATGCAGSPTTTAREACPAGTAAQVPAYNRGKDGLVAKGWVCGSIYSDGG